MTLYTAASYLSEGSFTHTLHSISGYLRSEESSWFLLDPARQTAKCSFRATRVLREDSFTARMLGRTAKGLVFAVLLANGLSENGLLLDISAPDEAAARSCD